jgi:glycosidase
VFNHVSREHRLARDGASTWEGHDELIELDHDDPQVRDLVVEVMTHWLARGAAGWRLDVAYAVPADFWRAVLSRVRAEYPDAIFIGEVIHGDYPAFAAAATLDSVTQYELWKAIWSSLNDRNLWELAWALERHDEFSRSLLMQTFVGNHDVDRIASTVGDNGAVIAHAILMTVPGMPSVYYGDEQAFRGQKGTGFAADDPVRPPLPDGPRTLAAEGGWMYDVVCRLIALRREHEWLTRARVEVLAKTNTTISWVCRADAHVAHVDIDLDTAPEVQIRVDGRAVCCVELEKGPA